MPSPRRARRRFPVESSGARRVAGCSDPGTMKTLFLAFAALGSLVGGTAVLAPSIDLAARVQDPIPAGPEHKMLMKLAGEWDATLSMVGPDGSNQTSTGVMSTRTHSDYFLVDDFTADMMGQKFKGHGVHGYCPLKKQYFTHWTDSFSPTPLYATGTYDEKTKKLTLTGECMGMSGKLEPQKIVTTFVDDDHHSFDLYMNGPAGLELAVLHIDYTRQQKKK